MPECFDLVISVPVFTHVHQEVIPTALVFVKCARTLALNALQQEVKPVFPVGKDTSCVTTCVSPSALINIIKVRVSFDHSN